MTTRRLQIRLCLLSCLMLTVRLSYGGGQEAVLHEGRPTLMFDAGGGFVVYVQSAQHGGEPAFRFPVQHHHKMRGSSECKGFVYVGRTRIAYDPVYAPKFRDEAFDLPRSEVKEAKKAKDVLGPATYIKIALAKKSYRLFVREDCVSRTGCDTSFLGQRDREVSQLFARTVDSFDSVVQEFERLTAGLRVPAQPKAVLPKETPSGSTRELPPPGEPEAPPSVDLKEGQTPEEVENILGKPEDSTAVDENLIYTYPTVKVIFKSRKLVDVQERKR